MANIRMSRINAEIQKCVAEIIRSKINNPNIAGMIVSVNKVDTAPDLSIAKIYISILGNKSEQDSCFKAIESMNKFIRHELAHMIRIKTVPELVFVYDTSFEEGQRILDLIDKIHGDKDE